MNLTYNPNFPSIDDLREKARRRIPKFAFEYLDGGCNEDINLRKNTEELRLVELKPLYLANYEPPTLKTELFGEEYDAPFGIAPIGLQGLIWPGAPEILARAATEHNIPFILSTVSTASIERIGEITQGRFWYQLYHPADEAIRNDILDRAYTAGCRVLVLLSDVPTFGFRPRDIRNGLAMPPRMTLRNVMQMLARPRWVWHTLRHGKPNFATMEKYMPKKGMTIKQLGAYMNATFSGRLSEARVAAIRDLWKGKLVLKGVASEEDTETCVRLGLDGIIISNHGGRQIDAGESTIRSLLAIAPKYRGKIRLMIDSGLRTGPDIARALACGAEFAFLGRTFMYSVAALGEEGGQHAVAMLKVQLKQVLDQICCSKVSDLPRHLLRRPE
ncbi:MAG: alpha-hydroxy-acid oxidizing protein [Gemmataceae bacterium]|nr:alpha-hydroxy-acid oxidizing protein [Gemmataceae bacterium]